MANPLGRRKGQNGSGCSIASAGAAQAACREVMFLEAGRSPSSGLRPNCCLKWRSHKDRIGKYTSIAPITEIREEAENC